MTEPAEPTCTLETERLVVFLPKRAHAAAIADYHARNARHLAPWSPPRPPNFATEAYWQGRIRAQHEAFEAGRAAQFVAAYRARPERVIATVALTEIVRGALRACLLGYGIDQDEQGKGLMREAVRAAVRFAFDTLKLHRVMANYLPKNERSGELLRALGFVVEGYARDYLFIDGRFRDHILTALTNDHLDNALELCTAF
ncbi:MAG: GNAT family N-acetyltransferase [Polyangiaceae bacterium]